jgi:Tol biopolymer transport system component
MKKIVLLITVVAFTLSGCFSKKITIQSDPVGASIYYLNAEIGKTPRTQDINFGKGESEQKYRLSLEGYRDTTLAISYKPKNITTYKVILEKREIVILKLVSYEPLKTKEGVRLGQIIRLSRAYLEQIERSPNVKSVTRITNMQDTASQVGTLTITPNGEHLAYSIYSIENGKNISNIWKQKIGTAGQTKVTFGTKADLFPSFAGNSDYLYFSSNRNNPNSQIWRISISGGGGLTKITSSQNEDYYASINPAGKLIVFNSTPFDGGDPQIWTINADGNLPTQLREGEFPVISPDGQKMLFVRPDKNNLAVVGNTRFNPLQIWMMDIDGSSETLLTQNTLYNCTQPGWSPDGEWIVFVSDEGLDTNGMNNNDIWIMRSNGSEKTQLTTNGSWDDCPIWSSKENLIYFRSNRGGNWNIWRFSPTLKN